jgi:hypothetical protein
MNGDISSVTRVENAKYCCELPRAKHVGILALEVYAPSTYVRARFPYLLTREAHMRI